MLLVIDIGNTNIVFGVHKDNQWLHHWRIQTDHLKTADEYEVIFRSLLSAGKICRSDVKNILVSSVVPTLVRPFSEMLARLFEEAQIDTLNPELYHKLPVKVLNPYEIGTDLVANAVAAHRRFGDLTMVIDFGTALTFTTIGANSEIAGVAIAPGLETAVSALAGKTAQLPEIHLTPPPSVLGTNTVHAIQSGIMYGYTGLVDQMIERTEKELNHKINVIATGGLSEVIAPLTKNIQHTDKMLTLEGLVLIAEIISL